MIAKFDCVTWSIDKNKTHMFEWYPGRPYMNRLPYNYEVSGNGCTLVHRPTGMPVIDYGYGCFKVLRSITDWEMYICVNQNNGTVMLENGVELGIAAIVAGGIGGTSMKITGNNAKFMYHDSIWSRSLIEIHGVNIKGITDSAHDNIPFIYCSGFTASDITIQSVNRIFSKGEVSLKNAFIRDDVAEPAFTRNINKNHVMPGMYIYSEGELTIEDSDIFIHNYIEAGMVTVINSHVVVQNEVSANLVLYSFNRVLLDNSIVDISRGKPPLFDITLDLIYIQSGNLILRNNSRITAYNNDSAVREYDCIMINSGRIVIDNSQIRTAAYANAVNVKCYGTPVINPSGGEIRKNCEFVTVSGFTSVFRFLTELDGFRMWVYVSGKVVTDVQYISGNQQFKRFEPDVYKAYIQNHIDEQLKETDKRENFAYMTASASAYSEADTFRIEAL